MKKLFVLGFAALLLVVFTIPAMADVKIGGIVFTDFYYLSRNEENAQYRGVVEADATRAYSYDVTAIQVPDITRLYARWTNEDNVGLYIELGMGEVFPYGVDNSDSSGINMRHAYGWWDITPNFQILAGHHTTPFSPLNPSQLLGTASGSLNIIGLGYGDFYSGRFAQVRGTFRFSKNIRLEVCLVDPNANISWLDPTGGLNDAVQNNNKIPRFDFTLPIYIGDFRIYPGFLWQRSSVDNTTGQAAGLDTDLDTYYASLGFRWGIGGFGLAAEGNYGQNVGNTRGSIGVSGSTALIDPVSGSEISIAASNVGQDANGNFFRDDSNTFNGWVDLSYKFGSIVPHLFFGYQKSEGDDLKNEGTTMMFGISVPISVAKGMTIRPEIAWYDDGDDNKLDTRTVGYTGTETGTIKQDYGSYFIGGVQFQITF